MVTNSKSPEGACFRACEGLVVVARLLARRPDDAALGTALALGRLCRRMDPNRLESVLRLVRHSYEASQA